VGDTRKSASAARYEELIGAHKDAECSAVRVPGGISLERGCCAEWKRESRYTTKFVCGTCTYQEPK
jgi:hypothetical protein